MVLLKLCADTSDNVFRDQFFLLFFSMYLGHSGVPVYRIYCVIFTNDGLAPYHEVLPALIIIILYRYAAGVYDFVNNGTRARPNDDYFYWLPDRSAEVTQRLLSCRDARI